MPRLRPRESTKKRPGHINELCYQEFKYALGVHLGINGYLFHNWYYSVLFGYNITTNLYDVKDVDKLNPSQIINVRTDIVNYYKQDGITVDEAYLQKSWNLYL